MVLLSKDPNVKSTYYTVKEVIAFMFEGGGLELNKKIKNGKEEYPVFQTKEDMSNLIIDGGIDYVLDVMVPYWSKESYTATYKYLSEQYCKEIVSEFD